jgi:hypothetical protein
MWSPKLENCGCAAGLGTLTTTAAALGTIMLVQYMVLVIASCAELIYWIIT